MLIVSTLGLEEEYRKQLKENCPQYEVKHIDTLLELSEEELGKVEILLTYGNGMTENIVSKMSSLKWVHSGQAGIEQMPQKLLKEKRVKVTNSRGINSITIAEYVLCMLLNLERNTYKFYEAYKAKKWDMETHLDEIAGKIISILGLGKVGMEIAKRAKAFDMHVIGVDLSSVNSEYIDEVYLPVDINRVASKSDYLVICMPLTKDTYHMIDKDVIQKMKNTATIVNVGRGPIVNMEDLVLALNSDKIRAAVIDVFDEEPVLPDSELWNVKNMIITPHIAGDRQKSYMPRMMKIMCNNLNLYPDFQKMTNPVNLELGF